ncbi:MAG: UDP-N-acetylglucosamine 2-epimerase (non-hydrolyzing) [Rhodocyclaceae bacterium]|nr:UDP-N-acetylglucosamine 2-epimerase (non-hydrolyzing) [Rhodocyclaceae bacterium]
MSAADQGVAPVICIVGARPNYMKMAPILKAFARHEPPIPTLLVHTGQHYDAAMNDRLFSDLDLPHPDINLEVGSASHAVQTAEVMKRFEPVIESHGARAVLVVGDVNSTLACALVAVKRHIPVVHVEAGLRSGDLSMPEEINRLVTDSISDWFFVTEPSGRDNLLREGKPASAVHYVGHVMVDNLFYQADKLDNFETGHFETAGFKAAHPRYGVVTLHRPSNVDDADTFARIGGALRTVSEQLPLIFPVHPRTRGNLDRFGIDLGPRVTLVGPRAYMEFLNLWKDASVALTDSGGLQEETTALGVPCVTIRENTERPVTVDEGTNVLVGTDADRIVEAAGRAIQGQSKQGRRPALWDGRAAERIVEILARELCRAATC